MDKSTDDEMKKAIASLNRGKAPDVYGVTAEHIYYGGPAVMNCVQTLINNILFNKDNSVFYETWHTPPNIQE